MRFLFPREEIEFPSKIEFQEKEFDIKVEIIRKKNSSLIVKDRTLHVRLSKYLTKNEKINHFNSLIEKAKTKFLVRKLHVKTIQEVLEEKKFTFNKINFTLVEGHKQTKIKENIIYFNNENKPEDIERKLTSALIKKFSPELKSKVLEINRETYNYSITDIVIKNSISKWGHCTGNNSIMINIKLLNAPSEILDYVIKHEIAHIKYKDHSKLFWKEVERFCPNYKKIRKELKTSPPSLFI